MSIAMDPEHPWRSAAFRRIKVRRVDVPVLDVAKHMSETAGSYGSSTADTMEWLDYQERYRVSHSLAATAMHAKELQIVTEVLDVSSTHTVDGSIARTDEMPYDFQDKSTRLEYSHEGRHMSVKPQLNEAAVRSMAHALSVEDFAKTAGFKLPRVTSANNTQTVSLLGTEDRADGMLINRFEELRDMAKTHASGDDYGARLHNLARIVCHSIVSEVMGTKHQPTKAASWQGVRSVLTAETPLLAVSEIGKNSWWYVGSESSANFRAFLLMGARGLHYYVSPGAESVYSRLRSDPEVAHDGGVVFVRLTGALRNARPQPGNFMEVLSHSKLATDFYFAYAASLGIHHQAVEILAQCAVAPFVYGDVATLPYKRNSPKLDACPYVLRPVLEQKATAVLHAQDLVFGAPVVAMKTLAGLGVITTAFPNSSSVATGDLLNQIMGVLSNPDAARGLLQQTHAAMSAGSVGLEWISPFTNVAAGHAACVAAFRENGALLSQYRRSVVKELAPLWTGVPMKDAMFGSKALQGKRYVELLMMQMAAGAEFSCMSEKYVQSALPVNVYSTLTSLRTWTAVHVFGRYSVAHDKTPSVPTESLYVEDKARTLSDSSSASLGFLQPAIPTSEGRTIGGKSDAATVRPTRRNAVREPSATADERRVTRSSSRASDASARSESRSSNGSTKNRQLNVLLASAEDARAKRQSGSSSETTLSVGRLNV
uniref:Uncharacterized protein n=1 Tax=Erysiphe necator associated chrysovirus 1 TaxID=2742542 RepID=A0A8E3YZN7_9VIRU|nr:hypothetical protein [Erysiphe necator associated chrysovirus 1]